MVSLDGGGGEVQLQADLVGYAGHEGHLWDGDAPVSVANRRARVAGKLAFRDRRDGGVEGRLTRHIAERELPGYLHAIGLAHGRGGWQALYGGRREGDVLVLIGPQ